MRMALFALIVLSAFGMGMVTYYGIHVVYLKRERAKQKRQRNHQKCWCMCKVV
jgi:CHASE3 domain sensor protein